MKRCILFSLLSLFSFNSYATIGPIVGDSTICVSGLNLFTDTTAGGTWNCNDTAIAAIDPITGEMTGISVGSVTITYSVGSGYATKIITVNPVPAPIIAPNNICEGSSVAVFDSTFGGYWNWFPIIVIGGNAEFVGNVFHGLNAGTVDISYTLSTGCKADFLIDILPLPPLITGLANILVDSTTILNNSLSGGKWVSDNTSIATIDSVSGAVTGLSAGVTTISYLRGCIRTTSLTVRMPSEIPNISAAPEGKITLYPNPVTNELIVSSSYYINVLVITNLIGQVIFTREYNTNKIQINVTDLIPGLYFIKINGREVRSFVRQ